MYKRQIVNTLSFNQSGTQLTGTDGYTKAPLTGTIDALMLAVRNQRKQPGTDDKVLAAWNGMMIAGMARAGRQLGDGGLGDGRFFEHDGASPCLLYTSRCV